MFRGLKERLLFLYKFLQSPLSTGNVFPSSRRLAQALLEPIPWERVNSLAELGAGTGAVTQHLPPLQQQPMQVLLFEKDPELRRRLKLRFPGYRYYPDSSRLRLALHNGRLEKLDCIVSGLPLWSMGSKQRKQMLSQAFASLKDDGLFVFFNYFNSIQKDLKPFFEIQSTTFVPLNFPPAVVYVCRKKANVDSEKKAQWLSVVAGKDSRVLLER
ncbi:class I SAM-dependent methyltransferase [Paenibacillus sp. GCM10012306]|uniref:class I SAM-dependent methyltransferase n=1 Tax=Paenibacillus sp. GCM10012306 TaxID=3317342 RepID=UPI00360DFEE2